MLPFLLAAREECPSHTRWRLSCALIIQDLAEGFDHIATQLRHYSTPLPPIASPVPAGSLAVGFPTLVTRYCVPYRHCAPSSGSLVLSTSPALPVFPGPRFQNGSATP